MNKLAAQMAYMAKVQTRTEAGLYLFKHQLQQAHTYLTLNNPVSSEIRYHHNDHMLSVVKWCGRLAALSTESLSSEKGLLLGALLHDMHHSGGKQPDTVNVANAVKALHAFAALYPKVADPLTLAVAEECIQCTVFPFTVEPTTLEQQIIRDADILHSIDINFGEILGEDLRYEIGVSRGEKVTRKQYAEGQLEFLKNIEMFTPEGEKMFMTSKGFLERHFEGIAKR